MSEVSGISGPQRRHLQALLAPFADQIDTVILFGSRATGRARDNSDIDLAIKGNLPDAAIDRLYTLFGESSLSVSVDLVMYDDRLYLPLKAHIDRVGVPLFSRAELLEAALS